MNQIKASITTMFSIVILAATLLPALHAFDHKVSPGDDHNFTETFTKTSLDCELCDFRITNFEAPPIYSYEFFIPKKEIIYTISPVDKVNLSPNPLFSLRAPPVVIS